VRRRVDRRARISSGIALEDGTGIPKAPSAFGFIGIEGTLTRGRLILSTERTSFSVLLPLMSRRATAGIKRRSTRDHRRETNAVSLLIQETKYTECSRPARGLTTAGSRSASLLPLFAGRFADARRASRTMIQSIIARAARAATATASSATPCIAGRLKGASVIRRVCVLSVFLIPRGKNQRRQRPPPSHPSLPPEIE